MWTSSIVRIGTKKVQKSMRMTPWIGTIPRSKPATSGQTMRVVGRSEEHTSELQSRQYLVCRLLLEKKKINLRRGGDVFGSFQAAFDFETGAAEGNQFGNFWHRREDLRGSDIYMLAQALEDTVVHK